jgi:hypothetical protein
MWHLNGATDQAPCPAGQEAGPQGAGEAERRTVDRRAEQDAQRRQQAVQPPATAMAATSSDLKT